MTRFSIKPLMVAIALAAVSVPAFAEPPTPWELKPDMGYGYDKEGKTFAYKMGTSNAGALLKGARRCRGAHCSSSDRTASSICGPARIWRATASSCSDRIEPAVIIRESG